MSRLATTIRIGPGALGEIENVWKPGWRHAAIIGDNRVVALFGARVRSLVGALARTVLVARFPPGERHKTRETKAGLEDRLLSARFPRDGVVVGVGGGLSLDVAGFVASTYMRGVETVYIPTTLLAQADAAIGGKTGVNTAQGKNLIGTFHMPSAILSDTDLLAGLPRRHWRNGLAEIVKHGVIGDRRLFEWLEENAAAISMPSQIPAYPLRRSVALKTGVVARDEREAGVRAVLNFGHTVGHAIERATDWSVPHGRAVAAGMVVEARVAVRRCGFPPDDLERLETLLLRLGFDATPRVPAGRMISIMTMDKKARSGEIRMALPQRIGTMARVGREWTCAVPAGDIEAALRRIVL